MPPLPVPPVTVGESDLSPAPDHDASQAERSIVNRALHTRVPTGETFAQLRVLVVDDHPDAASALTAVVELLGCPARACRDGYSALAVAAEFRPHVCFLDLAMPEMNGLELAALLREQAGVRPLVLVATTAFGDIEVRTQTALVGFHYHLTKPVDLPPLIAALTRFRDIFCRPTG